MFHPLHEDLVELQSGPCLAFDLSMSSAFGFAHYLGLHHINITTLPLGSIASTRSSYAHRAAILLHDMEYSLIGPLDA